VQAMADFHGWNKKKSYIFTELNMLLRFRTNSNQTLRSFNLRFESLFLSTLKLSQFSIFQNTELFETSNTDCTIPHEAKKKSQFSIRTWQHGLG
jgi:hypothetical protein